MSSREFYRINGEEYTYDQVREFLTIIYVCDICGEKIEPAGNGLQAGIICEIRLIGYDLAGGPDGKIGQRWDTANIAPKHFHRDCWPFWMLPSTWVRT